MSVRIRLRRVGRKKQPYFRLVVANSTAPRDGAYLDEVGFYNPRTRPAFLKMDLDKVDAWLEKGVELTPSAAALIRKARKGGDDEVKFVRPGEEAPRLKTATKPERRPASQSVATEGETTPEVEPKTDPLEGAAPDAEKAPPAEAAPGGPTKEAVASTETEAPKSDKAETKAEPAAEAAEAPAAEEESAEEESAEEQAPKAKAKKKGKAQAEAETESEAETADQESAEGEAEEK